MPEEDLTICLGKYKNSKDLDIENFLQNKAIEYERRHWCSTYLLIDEDRLNYNSFNICIVGYFTLSHKVLQIDNSVSNSVKRKLYNGLIKQNDYLHTILIGQVGKYIEQDINDIADISLNEILDSAFEIIYKVNDLITCSCVLLECRESDEDETCKEKEKRNKLHEKYKKYGFKTLQKEDSLIQYFYII